MYSAGNLVKAFYKERRTIHNNSSILKIMYKRLIYISNAAVKLNPVTQRGLASLPWRRKTRDTIEDQKAIEEVTKRKEVPEDTNMKHNLKMLAIKSKLTNKKSYNPPSDVETKIKEIVESLCDTKNADWRDISLADRRLKFKVLTKMMDEFEHDIPASRLSEVNTVADILEHFDTPVRGTTALEDLSKTKLPKNMHIQLDYNRFDPDNDPIFEGKTAFPGSNTYVTSIKYKRKYKNIMTTYEKPGYANHYENY